MQKWIEIYRRKPGEGLISGIVHGEVDGQPLSNDQVENLCVLGSVDKLAMLGEQVALSLIG
jgi:hypothetical protein